MIFNLQNSIREKSTALNVAEQMRDELEEVPHHRLEEVLGDTFAAVQTRRDILAHDISKKQDDKRANALYRIPAVPSDFNVNQFYDQIHGTACENVIGFIPMPLGVVGPVVVNDEEYMVPMATTEGALLASTNRGARAIRESGGAFCTVHSNGMTRSPVFALASVKDAAKFKEWCESPEALDIFKKKFSETTNFGKLKSVKCTIAGRHVYMRFTAETGDAMGMNMVGKGVNHIMTHILSEEASNFQDLKLISLSSNMCTDKKPSAINWTQGRGKSVIAEVVLPRDVVEGVLKTTIADLCNVNIVKNLVGSSLAGSIGGNNAHASNLITAFFIAMGQDPAQNVESSNCMVLMEPVENSENGEAEALRVSVNMPSIEVGTVGGGTVLETQKSCLDMVGLAGSNRENPGLNAKKLAILACTTVLAGELSLNAALASNHLISAHMDLNRKQDKKKESPSVPTTSKIQEQSKVQPGLKKQITSHDTELLGNGRNFGSGPIGKRIAIQTLRAAALQNTRTKSKVVDISSNTTENEFDCPILPIP